MPWWGLVLIIIGGLLLIIIIYISYMIFKFATHPLASPRTDLTKVKRFKSFEDKVQMSYSFYQSLLKEEVTIKSHDNLTLHAEIISKQNAKGTIIMLHGYQSSAFVDFTVMIKHCYEMGYNLVLPAQRGCGISEGKYITFGIKERFDLRDWINYANGLFGDDLPIILYGVSMGASTVIMSTELGLPKNVKMLVCDCGFDKPWHICQNVLVSTRHLPTFPFLYLSDFFGIVFAHFSLHKTSPVKALKTNQLPILYFHGRLDAFVPIQMGLNNYEHTKSPKEICIMDEAIHVTCMLKEEKRYQKTFDQFIEKYGK